jgi:FkbM family methyltransferase
MRLLFEILRRLLILSTGHGYDRSPRVNDLHHKLAYRFHKLLPFFGISGIQRIPVSPNRHLYVRAEDGGVGHQWIMYRRYEPFETQIVLSTMKPGMVVYNIGANIGYYTLLTSDSVGKSGQIVAFEPAASNLELLNRTIAENGLTNVRVMPVAVGATDGVATLAFSASNSGDHQVVSHGRGDRATTDVPLRSVDSLIAEGFPLPDAIIMDVQGSELDVLRGMEQLLRDPTLKTIFTEYWPGGLNARYQNGAKKFIERLEGAGFAFELIDEKRKQRTPISKEDLLKSRPQHEELNLLCRR